MAPLLAASSHARRRSTALPLPCASSSEHRVWAAIAEHSAVLVPAAVRALRSMQSSDSPDNSLLNCLAAGLHSMAEISDAICQALASSGAVEALAHLLGSSRATDMQLRDAAGALATIASLGAKQVVSVVASGAVHSLCRLLHNVDKSVQSNAAAVMAALSALAPLAVMAAGCIPTLVQLLGCSSNDGLLHNGACCLDLLAKHDSECGLAAIREGGLAALRQVQRRAGPAARPAVERAVHSLELCQAAARAGSELQPFPPSAVNSAPSQGAAASGAAPPAPAKSGPPDAAAQPCRRRSVRMCAVEGCGGTSGLKRCAGCGAVRYCSRQCQRAHWPAHRSACQQPG
ncbi:hypothetical protein ABPG77_010346 [Micractinium sp. CCAP 211/92]